MLIVVSRESRRTVEVELQVNHPLASVGDLADALGVAGEQLSIGATALDQDLGLDECGLHDGVEVHVGAPRAEPPAAAWHLAVVDGLEAGRRVPLAPGTHVIGRSPEASVVLESPTVSAHQAELTVPATGSPTLTDLGSRNGTWVRGTAVRSAVELDEGEEIATGALRLVVRRTRTDDRPDAADARRHAGASGVVPFNRPPRRALAEPPAPLPPPDPPKPVGQRTPIMIVTAVAPLLMAGTMVLLYRNPAFALFALMSPVMVVGGGLERRRRQKTGARKDQRRYEAELADLDRAIQERAVAERRRLAERAPDPSEVARRAALPSTRLWERRPEHDDLLELRLGLGPAPWDPPIASPSSGRRPPDLDELAERWQLLPDAPLLVDLSDGGVIGLAGDRAASLAVARSLLVQAAVHHGPADLPVMVLAAEGGDADWDWAKWLPHARDAATGSRLLSADPEVADALVSAALRSGGAADAGPRGTTSDDGPTLLVVVDDESLLRGRRSPTRNLLRGSGGRVAGIVLAPTVDQLPAMCTWVVDVRDPDGRAVVTHPSDRLHLDDVLLTGVPEPVAREVARDLARFEDPELAVVGAGLPDRCRLLPLLGLDDVSPESVLAHWRELGSDPPAAGAIGVDEDDVFDVDLDRDGPHGLVAGTTGAGKSELLRTLVASLAVGSSPEALTFVLVDFKGGSAFDACARLPHTVGLVTDLDESLAERALRCLEAELHFRERRLRDVGASDLREYRRMGSPTGPMPRLLVVVDEFATLKAELPEFVESLVGVAQRGRSLGVHMILATQRPSGAISENIRANTNLRIALRVQDQGDSSDVIGVSDAAQIPRGRPGRAYVRLGPGEVVAIQTALSTAGDAAGAVAPVEVVPFAFGPRGGGIARSDGEAAATDLELLVSAAAEAFELSGWAEPRRPWPDPLPGRVTLDELVERADERVRAGRPDTVGRGAPFALADDPDAQDQYPVGWDRSEGSTVVLGMPGAGTTTAVATMVLSATATTSPDRLHVYVLDMGAGELAPLAGLPHVGAVVAPSETERQVRLVRHLRGQLDARRSMSAAERAAAPDVVLVLDGYSAFAAAFRDGLGSSTVDDLERIVADGPEVGITCLLAAERVGAVPARLTGVIRRRLLMRLADLGDYGMAGIRSQKVPAMGPGRAIDATTGQHLQVALVPDLEAAVAAVAARTPAPRTRPDAVGELPTSLRVDDLPPADLSGRPWRIPVGVAESDLGTCALAVYEGEHAFVGGSARSGRTSALALIAEVVRRADPGTAVVAVTTPRSTLPSMLDDVADFEPAELAAALDAVEAARAVSSSPVLLLVDDAELVDDTADGRLATLVGRSSGPVLVVAAGRGDVLRGQFNHWSRALRRSKLGLLLQPDLDLDGDLLGVHLPRRLPVPLVPGRGFVVNAGVAQLAQVALLRG